MPIRLLALCLTFAAPLLFLGAALAGVVGWSIAIFGALSVLLPGGLLVWRLTPAQPTERGDGGQAPSIERPPSEGAEAKGPANTEAILEGLPDPLILLDREQRILRGNPAAERLLERKLAGRDLPSVLRHPRLLDAATRVLAEGGEVTVEFTIPGKVERFFTARLAGLATPGADGAAAIISLHDVTAVKRAEQMRGDFVANVSHELRTPLSLIKGYVELLIDGDLGRILDSQRAALQVIRERTASLSRLIHNLTMLQSVPREALNLAPVSLVDVVRRVLAEFQKIAQESGVVFCEESPEDLPLVLGDHERLQLAFGHLVDNAIKFSPDGGVVTLRAWVDEEMICVSVADEGIGISPDSLGRIFERFYQVDGSTRRRFGGMGIGLALVWEIVEVHGGSVRVESEPGKGSVFTVLLPMLNET